MKIKLKIAGVIIGLMIAVTGCEACRWSMESKTVPCTVLGKMTSGPGYKVSARYILLLDHNGCDFDLSVSPITYWKAEPGQTLYFSLQDDQMCGPDRAGKGILGMFIMMVGIACICIILTEPWRW